MYSRVLETCMRTCLLAIVSSLVLLALIPCAQGEMRGLVTGRVLDSAGAPIAGAELFLVNRFGHRKPSLFHRWHPTRTDDRGAFSVSILGIIGYNYTLWVMADGSKTRKVDLTSLLPWAGRKVGDIHLTQGVQKKGEVRFSFKGLGSEPWAGKRVEIRMMRKAPYRRKDLWIRTDEHGCSPTINLPPGSWEARILPCGAREVKEHSFSVRTGVCTPCTFELDPCCTVSGRVLDTKGRPVPWAQVGTHAQGKEREERTQGYRMFEYHSGWSSMGDGTYRQEVKAETRHMYAWSCGYEISQSQPFSPAAGKGVEGVDIVLEPLKPKPGFGCIRFDLSEPGNLFIGRALARCQVQRLGDKTYDIMHPHPDMEGRYCFYWLAPGTYCVSVTPLIGFKSPSTVVTVGAGEFKDISFSDRLPCELTGEVLSPDGTPLEGAHFFWKTTSSQEQPEKVVSRKDGSFCISNLRSGPMLLTAFKSGVGWARARDLRVAPDRTKPVVFTLQPWFTVQGRVLDETGAPVADAAVQVSGASYNGPSEHGMRQPRVRYEDFFKSSLLRNKPVSASITKKDGFFVVGDLIPGKHYLRIEHEEFKSMSMRFVLDLVQDASIGNLVIKRIFRGFGVVKVEVFDAQGNAVAGAEVDMIVGPKSWSDLKTGKDGTVTVERVPAGMAGRVDVEAEDWAPDRQSGWTVNQGESQRLVFRLDRGGIIEGTVVGPIGEKISEQEVRVSGGKCGQKKKLYTDLDGTFRIENLAPGTYTVFVIKDDISLSPSDSGKHLWSQKRKVELEQGVTVQVDFDMQERAVLEGRIGLGNCLLPRQGMILAFMLADPRGRGPKASVNEDGSFRLDCLAPGAYKVEFWVDTFGRYSKDGLWFMFNRWKVRARSGEIVRFAPELPLGSEVRGSLKLTGAQDGNPIPRITFHVGGRDYRFMAWSGKDGSFVIPYLPPGDYTLGLSEPSGFKAVPRRVPFSVQAGKDIDDLVIPVKKR
jgi:hypothetical protein